MGKVAELMINRKLKLEDFCGDVTDAIIVFPLFQYLSVNFVFLLLPYFVYSPNS